MNIITQEARYRQSLMEFAGKYGVSKASRKYNRSRSVIYYWKARWDGTEASLVDASHRPHHHPNETTSEEIALIKRYHSRNPDLGLTELWHRLKKAGYTRRPETLYRVMRRLKMIENPKPKKKYKPKPFQPKTFQTFSLAFSKRILFCFSCTKSLRNLQGKFLFHI